MNTNWDERFVGLAFEVASWSKDPNTKVGAVIVDDNNIVVAVGFNGFARKVHDTKERLENREIKNKLVVHAERNACYSCARKGVSALGCRMYVSHPPCVGCANSAIQVGIKTIVINSEGHPPEFLKRWEADLALATEVLAEAGVEIVEYRKP